MGSSRRFLALAACTLLVLGGLALVACGEDEGAGSGEADAPWSDPALRAAAGSPDGTSGLTSPEDLLTALRARVASGRGLADATFERDVQSVAAVLWEPDVEGAGALAARVHMQLSSVAAEVGGWLAAAEGARAEREASHPVDVKIHDAFLAATARGPEAYRTWCGDAGGALLRELEAARRARFFPPK